MDLQNADDGNTALIAAALGGHAATVEALLNAGATVDVPNHAKSTALTLAAEHGRAQVVSLLLERSSWQSGHSVSRHPLSRCWLCSVALGHCGSERLAAGRRECWVVDDPVCDSYMYCCDFTQLRGGLSRDGYTAVGNRLRQLLGVDSPS